MWKIEELRNLVEEIHGKDQKDLANIHINAVDWKIRAASYHSFTATSSLGIATETLQETNQPIRLVLTNGEDAQELRKQRHIHEANVLACAQTVYSISDVVAHVIKDCLVLSEPGEWDVNLKYVQKYIPSGKLTDTVVALIGNRKYEYLRDFVNTIKHRNLVQTVSNIDLKNNPLEYEIKFQEFEYKDRIHDEKMSGVFLEELKDISLQFLKIGSSLNEHLKAEKI